VAKILIVDDERQILRLLHMVLTRAGHEICTADNPRDALEMCSPPAPFDLVLTDVDMPVLGGHDLVRWIAARNPGIRVMLMSAFDAECDECPYAPRCDVIRKPFTPAEAVKQISAALTPPAR
jgi:DNA-binding NtrC family response regulator